MLSRIVVRLSMLPAGWRVRAATRLRRDAKAPHIHCLIACLTDADDEVSGAVRDSLAAIGPVCVPALIRRLANGTPADRAAAA